MDKVKKILLALVAILTGAFLFEKSRADSAKAVADNEDLLNKLDKGNQQLAENNGSLADQEAKRKEDDKEAQDEKNNNQDPTDFLNNRKPS